jgi:REP element-mobilizing transposase RayT
VHPGDEVRRGAYPGDAFDQRLDLALAEPAQVQAKAVRQYPIESAVSNRAMVLTDALCPVRPDLIHLLSSVPPHLAPSKVMQAIKGKTSHRLLQDSRRLRQEFWGRHLWARGYVVCSSGNVTDETIKVPSPRTTNVQDQVARRCGADLSRLQADCEPLAFRRGRRHRLLFAAAPARVDVGRRRQRVPPDAQLLRVYDRHPVGEA